MRHARAKIFFALYCAAIVYLSLYPWEFRVYPRASQLMWAPVNGRRQVMDGILNVLFYVPMGAAGVLALRSGWRAWVAAGLAAGGLSWGIEWLQLWSASRYGNLNDLTFNSIGAAAGASLALVALRGNWFPGGVTHSRAISRWRVDATGAFLLAAWMLWQMFPFVPALSLPRLIGIAGLLAPWSWQGLLASLLGFAVLRVALGRSPWLGIAFAGLLAQAFLVDRSLAPSSVCGAAGGWLAAELVGTTAVRWLGIALPTWLVYEELRPFAIAPGANVFSWAPFATWYGGPAESFYPVIFGKLFLYLSVVWTLRSQGGSWWRAVGIPGVILAAGEWAQQYLVGRTPESTDLVLLAGSAVLLAMCKPDVRVV